MTASQSERFIDLYTPKLVTIFRRGYTRKHLYADFLAGLTVAVVALPLSIALAIASGTTPERGLITAVVAGFLISAFGGSRFQIGGPTGAFVVIVFQVVHEHGYDGLALATVMAGVLLMIFGFARLGTWIKYIPFPVVAGFTSGIALIILSSQINDVLGLGLKDVPPGFIDKWAAFFVHLDALNPMALGVAGLSLLAILGVRHFFPKAPVFLIGVAIGALAVWGGELEVETIRSRFGELPRGLPFPSLPTVSFDRLVALFPSALTIALLGGIESLLSAVVADGMTGRRHRSNCELVGQGLANAASGLMGGICATGAIARTATNIRAGGRTPMAGIFHSAFLLMFMLAAAPLAGYLPLASLGAVLAVVAWNMSDFAQFRSILRGPPGDRVVLVVTFLLTVLLDLTAAIQVGVVMASLLFMHRMAGVVEAESGVSLVSGDVGDFADQRPSYDPRIGSSSETMIYTINGPFFFGVASRLGDVLRAIGRFPRKFVVDMSNVPVIDATAAHAFEEVLEKCVHSGTRVVLVGVKSQPRAILRHMGVTRRAGVVSFAPDLEAAKALPLAVSTGDAAETGK